MLCPLAHVPGHNKVRLLLQAQPGNGLGVKLHNDNGMVREKCQTRMQRKYGFCGCRERGMSIAGSRRRQRGCSWVRTSGPLYAHTRVSVHVLLYGVAHLSHLLCPWIVHAVHASGMYLYNMLNTSRSTTGAYLPATNHDGRAL